MEEDLEALAGSHGVSVHAGFPNPAAGSLGRSGQRLALDLNQLLIQHPSTTYLFRISGNQWEEQGIFDGDLAVIDRALQPRPSDLVIAWRDSSFELYRYRNLPGDEAAWGVVSAVIHQYLK